MKLQRIEQLACPSPTARGTCGGRIGLDQDGVPPVLTGRDDLRDGLLRCASCGHRYPVLGGVAILRPDALSWLRAHHGAIAAGLLEVGGLSPELAGWLDARGWRHANQPQSNYYESARWVDLFLATHYDDAPAAADQSSPLARQIADAPSVFTVVSAMLRDHAPAAPARALDVGTNVGGMAARLAPSCGEVWAIDIAFNPLLAARRIHHGAPVPLTEYRRPLDGHHHERRALRARAVNAEFVLASARSLPFAGRFDLVTALNVIDSAPDPRALIQSLVAALEPGGCLVITSPYSWGSDDVPLEEWIGGDRDEPSDRALIGLLNELDMNILAEQDNVPWVLREHQRWYRVFLTHCVLARKPARP